MSDNDVLFYIIITEVKLMGELISASLLYNYTLLLFLFLPVTYAVVNFLKRKEGIDVIDEKVNYNPFCGKEGDL